jgi:hypothetical protein
MKTLWCWRCAMDVPMLDEDEWEVLMRAREAGERDAALGVLRGEALRRGLPMPRPLPPDTSALNAWQWHMLAGYEMFTGVQETVANAVWHHRASQYGPPCLACGKALRTPRASLCPACGWGMS